ncbi:MAG: PEP-CTERM sorting domain-containing protein [Cyanobacteria bacterium P01_F01_bin.153]
MAFNLSSFTSHAIQSAVSLGAIACIGAIAAPQANAGTIVNGWNYAVDSFNDGITNGQLGGKYEFYGIGIKQVGNEVIVGIDSRFDIAGDPGANIFWGDLFFNVGGGTMSEGNGEFFAVRFAEDNAAGVTETGVFSDVTGKFVDKGFDSVALHEDRVNQRGGDASVGDLEVSDPYFDASYNVINSGTKVGDITVLDEADLTGLGFDLNAVPGAAGQVESGVMSGNRFGERQSFGFKFELPPGMIGEFVAHIAAECFNDSMAIAGTFVEDNVDVPEPSMLLGLAGVSGLGLVRRRRHA